MDRETLSGDHRGHGAAVYGVRWVDWIRQVFVDEVEDFDESRQRLLKLLGCIRLEGRGKQKK